MGEWTPVVIGYGFLVLLFIAAALSPRAWWVQELARRYGVQPSGPFGIFTRRDLGRRAALSMLACIGCLAASMAAFEVMERIPEYKRLNLVAGDKQTRGRSCSLRSNCEQYAVALKIL